MPDSLSIALAPGDGIGPEIMDAVLEIFRYAGVMDHLAFVPVEMGRAVFEQGNTRGMTDAAIRTTEDLGVLFKGPMETPKGSGGKSINVTARKLWNAFANLRHFRTLPGVETVYSKAGVNVNFYVVRENIEDTYGGIEHRLSNDTMQCKRLITAPGSDRVHRFAFQTARRLGIDRVHCGHKANIMKLTDGLFLDRFRVAARDFPSIATEDVIIDALCMGLVIRPHHYRMVVLPNLQGDIVSDLAAGLVGGLGFAPSANIGNHISIFEAVHGTAPDIAGRGIANPTALLLSGLMMLRHVNLLKQAAAIENALMAALESGARTADFGDPSRPALGTRDFARAIADRLGQRPSTVPAAADSDAATPVLHRPPRPHTQEVIRTFTNVVSHVVGCDIYLDTRASTIELAEQMMRLCEDTPFRLTLISNRGTQVWPTGSVFTECVDYYRVRFELRDGIHAGAFGQGPTIALLDRVAEKFVVCSYELLRVFDGQKGYSLAQGQ
jgi:isocitrate dehydrogenase